MNYNNVKLSFKKLPIFRAKNCIDSAVNGGLSEHNSYKITPKLHMSDLKEYGLDSMISGERK